MAAKSGWPLWRVVVASVSVVGGLLGSAAATGVDGVGAFVGGLAVVVGSAWANRRAFTGLSRAAAAGAGGAARSGGVAAVVLSLLKFPLLIGFVWALVRVWALPLLAIAAGVVVGLVLVTLAVWPDADPRETED